MNFQIVAQRQQDAVLLDPLLDRTFGAGRQVKTVYRLREGVADVARLRFVAIDQAGSLLASIRFWPVTLAAGPALLLGPLAVEPALQGRGLGKALVHHGLKQAGQEGYGLCFVVGEPAYYGPYGFVNAPALGLALPGPVEPHRFQALALRPGALDGCQGTVEPAEAPPLRARGG